MLGKQDVMFAGGGEELDWTLSCLFDAMGAMSSKYNDTPERASRAFDAGRDGFVISGGGGIVVLESLDHALARGAKIYAEVTGYAATSDGHDMVAPSGEGGERAMRLAMATLPEDTLSEAMQAADAIIVMKIGQNIDKVRRALKQAGKFDAAWLVEYASMPNQKMRMLSDTGDEPVPYFSIIVVHGNGRRP